MREFFNGWRRKTGCVTLVLVCVLLGAWARSYSVFDSMQFSGISHQYCVLSSEGEFQWWSWRRSDGEDSGPSSRTDAQLVADGDLEVADDNIAAPQQIVSSSPRGFQKRVVHYRLVAIPLTLLSAYLILWKPRPKVERDE
jgi:hypothetical protein